mmetsp:Transcript_41899/g.127063  ORF Transcript_41899/g.127063 Transcript_41899/m.127063 type:complete len:258 (-) Transcript_41899:334-1107(-)
MPRRERRGSQGHCVFGTGGRARSVRSRIAIGVGGELRERIGSRTRRPVREGLDRTQSQLRRDGAAAPVRFVVHTGGGEGGVGGAQVPPPSGDGIRPVRIVVGRVGGAGGGVQRHPGIRRGGVVPPIRPSIPTARLYIVQSTRRHPGQRGTVRGGLAALSKGVGTQTEIREGVAESGHLTLEFEELRRGRAVLSAGVELESRRRSRVGIPENSPDVFGTLGFVALRGVEGYGGVRGIFRFREVLIDVFVERERGECIG